MIEIISIDSDNLTFTIKGPLSDKLKEEIVAICHKHKNLYAIGYPHGREKRKKMAAAGVIYKHWDGCPGVTLCYLCDSTADGGLVVSVLFPANANKDKTKDEITHSAQLWQTDVIDAIIARQ